MSQNVSLRIRQIKPDFWVDEEMAVLQPAHRLFYIGLWQVADDAGYFPWKLGQIAYALHVERPILEGAVLALNALPGQPRLVVQDCGLHAQLTRLAGHQHYAKSTHRVERHQLEHRRVCMGEEVAGPGTRPKEKPRGSPAEAPLRAGEGVGVGEGVGEGEGDAPAGTENLPRLTNLYQAYTQITGSAADAAATQWIDDLCKQFDRDKVRGVMYQWPGTGKLLGWTKQRLREATHA